ncbi:MAG: glycine cleavage system aminomethyltransferase GcvT [Muribaculaceae bacterium]|nr:glycine cleavage system aminomethyltransferase GcvT [Muribaculaceae bacterium]
MEELKTTCLHGQHKALGAKMSPFAGFDMPIEYEGIEAEHNAVRNHAGVFDVSHMGEVRIEGADATAFVNHIFTNDVAALDDGQIAYGMLTNENGGVVDDLLVYRVSDREYFLVINAANIAKDEKWILDQMELFPGEDLSVSLESECWSELAVQGPEAEARLQEIFPDADLKSIGFYRFVELEAEAVDEDGEQIGLPVVISRTGYTGEDGFEIYADEAVISELWKLLLESGVKPCGLGCRDTLRFEAGLPLYGDELADDITPLEAGLGMFVKLDKNFVGRDILAAQKSEGLRRKIVGLEVNGMAIPRHGYEILAPGSEEVIGHVTTGYRSISLGKNLAMALINADHAALGSEVLVRVRKKVFPATVIKKRFYTPNYKK